MSTTFQCPKCGTIYQGLSEGTTHQCVQDKAILVARPDFNTSEKLNESGPPQKILLNE